MAARSILDDVTHQQVLDLHQKVGENEARRLLGNLSPECYARTLARLTQQAGTLALIKAHVAALPKVSVA